MEEHTQLDKPGNGNPLEWLKELLKQAQLAWRLFIDPRVAWGYKIIPVMALLYLLSPVDLIPDSALGLGQLDDVAILFIGLNLFLNFCPTELVEEHQAALRPDNEEVWMPERPKIIDIEPENPISE